MRGCIIMKYFLQEIATDVTEFPPPRRMNLFGIQMYLVNNEKLVNHAM